jgi:hypothetical protein
MNDDELRRRMRAADGIGDSAKPPHGFGVQVRKIAGRRRQRRVAMVSGTALSAVLIAVWAFSPKRDTLAPPVAIKPTVVEELTLEEIRRAADEASALADAIRIQRKQHDALAAARTTLRRPVRTFEAELALNEAVAMRFSRAERLVAQGDWPAAAKSYERVIELLPDSSFAVDARTRLSQSSQLQ